jgi:uncharacterized membrane protein YhhN
MASLFFGLTYPILQHFGWPGIAETAWKVAGVGLLVPYTLRRHHSGEFAMLAVVLAFWALGDGLIEVERTWGALAFIAGHITAIALFLRHRRVKPVFSQKLLAAVLFLFTPLIAYFLPDNAASRAGIGFYALFVGGMAAMAWSSNFPRYRVGIGAVMFVISDLLIFARDGVLSNWPPVSTIIWYLYYFGVVAIAVGVVQTLVKRGHFAEE